MKGDDRAKVAYRTGYKENKVEWREGEKGECGWSRSVLVIVPARSHYKYSAGLQQRYATVLDYEILRCPTWISFAAIPGQCLIKCEGHTECPSRTPRSVPRIEFVRSKHQLLRPVATSMPDHGDV